MARQNFKKSHRKTWTSLVVLLALVAAGGVLWWHFGHNHTSRMANDITQPPAQQSQKKTIPTNAQDLKNPSNSSSSSSNTNATSDSSSSSSNTGTSSSTNTSGKTKVSPFITTTSPVSPTNGNVNFNGGVQGVVESGGTCTLTLVKGSQTVTQTKTGFVSGTYTTCGVIQVPFSKLSTGTWQVTLSYSSSTSEGTSATSNINITQ